MNIVLIIKLIEVCNHRSSFAVARFGKHIVSDCRITGQRGRTRCGDDAAVDGEFASDCCAVCAVYCDIAAFNGEIADYCRALSAAGCCDGAAAYCEIAVDCRAVFAAGCSDCAVVNGESAADCRAVCAAGCVNCAAVDDELAAECGSETVIVPEVC